MLDEQQEILSHIKFLLNQYTEMYGWIQTVIKVMQQFQNNLAYLVKLDKELSEELDGMRNYLTNTLKEIKRIKKDEDYA